jgi:hypothetical protein
VLRREQTRDSLRLSVSELTDLFEVACKPLPPFVAEELGGERDMAAAHASLVARGLVTEGEAGIEVTPSARRLLGTMSASHALLRLHRSTRDRALLVWFNLAGAQTVRSEAEPGGAWLMSCLPTRRLRECLAADTGLGRGRTIGLPLEVGLSVDQYGGLLSALDSGAEEAKADLLALGVDDQVATEFAAAMGGSLTAVSVSVARPSGDGSALEIDSVVWLDAGPLGAVRVEGPGLAEVRRGLPGNEPMRLASVDDEVLLDEVLSLVSSRPGGTPASTPPPAPG